MDASTHLNELTEANQLLSEFLSKNPDVLNNERICNTLQNLSLDTFRALHQILSIVGKNNPQVLAFVSSLEIEQAQKIVLASLDQPKMKMELQEKEGMVQDLIEKMQRHQFGISSKGQYEAARKLVPLLIDNLLSGNNASLTKSEIGRQIEFSDYHVDEVIKKLGYVLADEEILLEGKVLVMEETRLIFDEQEEEKV